MSQWLCKMKAFQKKRDEQVMSPENKKRLHDKLERLAVNWEKGDMFKNVQESGWNNFETFEKIFTKSTKLPSLDLAEFPINFKDLKKFEIGLKLYNEKIAKPKGFFASKFHVTRAALKDVPELAKFETELVNETQFFRQYTIDTNGQVNDILRSYKDLALSFGANYTFQTLGKMKAASASRELKRLMNEYDTLAQQIQLAPDLLQKQTISKKIRENRNAVTEFYSKGAGKANKVLLTVLQGADPESIPDITASQKTLLNNITKNYSEVRKATAINLMKGLDKIIQMGNVRRLDWVEPQMEKLRGLVKNIEFQKTVDEHGKPTQFKHMQNVGDFLQFGFKKEKAYDPEFVHNQKVAFSPHYMSQYTLGILKTIKKVETALERNDLTLDRQLELEINSWDGIINRAKGKGSLTNPVYDADPYFFLKKYVSDVGVFNYKTHVKSTFKKAMDTLLDDHLNPAKKAGNKDLEESTMSMMDLIKDVYSDIQHMDPKNETFVNDAMRAMTSMTYFRLMGGNWRSALRNKTQRLNELVEFGLQGFREAQAFYKNSGLKETNLAMLQRQQQRFGLQWSDGSSVYSDVISKFKGEGTNLSEASRGALLESYDTGANLYIDKNGELTVNPRTKAINKASGFVANATGKMATGAAAFHRIAEDWNRSGTFRTAFALAHSNIESTSKAWKTRQILTSKQIAAIKAEKGNNYLIKYDDLIEVHKGDVGKAQAQLDKWTEFKAGQVAYNSVMDLHFEYAKWAKAKAIRITGKESWPVQFAKAGLGQFANYRFNMVNLMHRWFKEGTQSIGRVGFKKEGFGLEGDWVGDFNSEEMWRPIRFGILQATIAVATIGGKVNLQRLANNDVIDTGNALWTWLGAKREELVDGEMSAETEEKLGKATYGQGGVYFLGPNVSFAMGVYEYLANAEAQISNDPDDRTPFEDSVKDAITEKQQKFKNLSLLNSQLARTMMYTRDIYSTQGIIPAMQFESGLFLDKDQKEWRRWFDNSRVGRFLGLGGKGRKKQHIRSDMSDMERKNVLDALSGF